MIFASEIAAAIGYNKYKDPDEIKILMWKRIYPESFQLCIKRTESDWKDKDLIINNSDIDISAALKIDIEDDATKEVVKIQEKPIRICKNYEIDNIKNVLNDESKNTKYKRKYIKNMITDINVKIKPCTKQKIDRVIDKIVISGNSMSKENMKKELECLKVSDSKELTDAVIKSVNTSRGSERESEALEIYEKTTNYIVSGNNDKFYKKSVGEGVIIGGRIDGMTGTKLIEVKCRRNRLFNMLPKYEKVQIHAYMFLTGTTLCDLVQKFNGKIQIDTYEFDVDYWEEICNKIIEFWKDFKDLLENEYEQDQLLRRSTL